MRVVVGGASGFLGGALVKHLRASGHDVTRLVRSDDHDADASRWDPLVGRVDQTLIDAADVVVNLSGAPVSRWPRTKNYREEILRSRTSTTGTLAAAVAASPNPPALISASGMSFYGTERGSEVLTESSTSGDGFLADVSIAWEAAAAPAVAVGARVCFLRTSLVLEKSGGVLALMLPVWKLGGGAKLGKGQQFMSVISRRDWVRAVAFLVESQVARGPFNLAAPSSQTNADYTDALGEAVHRPTFLAIPSFAIKAALGGISDDLLGSLRVSPEALLDAGFTFTDPDLSSAIASALR